MFGLLPLDAQRPDSAPEKTAFQPDKSIVYKKVGKTELRLDLFVPAGHKSADRRPAIVFFFGGGWIGGTPSQFYPHAKYLASRGMVAMAAEYRTKTRHGTTPFEAVQDGRSAIRWVRAHARELGVDPKRIAAGGGSAGGQVAAATGLLKGLNEPGEDTSVSCRPDALVLFNPVIDNGPHGYGYDRIGERYKEFSPLHNITATPPPTMVFLGTQDNLIPVRTIRRFQSEMQKAGALCDVHLYTGQKHAFFNYGDGKNDYYYQTLREADKFLRSLKYLKGEPTI